MRSVLQCHQHIHLQHADRSNIYAYMHVAYYCSAGGAGPRTELHSTQHRPQDALVGPCSGPSVASYVVIDNLMSLFAADQLRLHAGHDVAALLSCRLHSCPYHQTCLHECDLLFNAEGHSAERCQPLEQSHQVLCNGCQL